nr:MAG TPA: repressor domain protein [Caudoviricetes sp.]
MAINGEPWFVGKDVADILGYSNSRKALLDHVDNEDKYDGVTIRDAIGRGQNTVVINESGLYSLILLSKMPNAKKFKRWVTSEVLPSIRGNGAYIAGQENMTPEQIMAAGLQAAQKIIESKNRQIEAQKTDIQRMKPKEIFADAVSASHTSILIGALAKIISQNGVQIGQNRLFAWMRENGYLITRRGADYNMPTQKSMEMKLFEIKERTVNNPDGSVRIIRTALVTGKGQQYFINKFLTKE